MVVEFDAIAKNQLREVYDYIKKSSIQNAEKLVNELVERAESRAAYPRNIHWISIKPITTELSGILNIKGIGYLTEY